MHFNIKCLTFAVGLLLSKVAAFPQEVKSEKSAAIESYSIRVGTLELDTKAASHRFVSNGKEEVWGPEGGATGSPSEFGLPGLRLIGFKLENAAVIADSKKLLTEISDQILREHPNVKAVAQVFEGETGKRIFVPFKGVAKVLRVDIRLQGREITLWEQTN